MCVYSIWDICAYLVAISNHHQGLPSNHHLVLCPEDGGQRLLGLHPSSHRILQAL